MSVIRYTVKGTPRLRSTGAALQIAMDWQQQPEHANSTVCSLPLWSMAAKRQQAAQCAPWREVMTLEDHLLDGGFGSWMLEAQALAAGQGAATTRITPRALDAAVCGTVGSQATLNRLGGLTPA